MKTDELLFKDDELVERYDDNWSETEGWKRLPTPWSEDFQLQLAGSVQQERAGVTICFGGQAEPLGSGVLVRGAKGYGILTAGHVCRNLERKRKGHKGSSVLIRCAPQWPREPVRPGQKDTQTLKPFEVIKAIDVYDPAVPVPDFGCLVLPEVDGRSMTAWGTFINLAEGRRTRNSDGYKLQYNVWVAAGYVAERSGKGDFYNMHFMGGQEALYERAGRRYLYIKSGRDTEIPSHLGGMSGSGVWEIPVSSKGDTKIMVDRPILRGVSFWQEMGTGALYAHDLATIADDVLEMVDRF